MDAGNVIPIGGYFGCDAVVIEDYQALATEIASSLRRRGLSVQVALDGAAALALARQCRPRVALVDCALPDVDGIQLVRQLGQFWPETTFLVVSGQVGGVSAELAKQLRIHAFLNKPLPMRALAQAVERLVRTARERKTSNDTPKAWFALGLGSPTEGTVDRALATYPDQI